DEGRLADVESATDGTFSIELAGGVAAELIVVLPAGALRRVGVASGTAAATTDLGDIGPAGSAVTLTAPWHTADTEAVAALVPVGFDDDLAVWTTNRDHDEQPQELRFAAIPDGEYLV